MVPAALVIFVAVAVLAVLVGILWLERSESTGKVTSASLAFERQAKAMEFEIDRLKKWSKMPEDYRGGSAL